MNKKGFTLIELLGVLVILSIIMGVALPNVVSVLDKNKREAYISDAKKFLALAKTELSTRVDKPVAGEAVVISLKDIDNQDLTDAPDGNEYSKNSSVIVTQKDGVLTYYITLYSVGDNNTRRGLYLVESTLLDDNNARLKNVKKGIPEKVAEKDIVDITGIPDSSSIRYVNK